MSPELEAVNSTASSLEGTITVLDFFEYLLTCGWLFCSGISFHQQYRNFSLFVFFFKPLRKHIFIYISAGFHLDTHPTFFLSRFFCLSFVGRVALLSLIS